MRGRMDLKRKLFLGVQQLNQEREALMTTISVTKKRTAVSFHQPVQVLACESSVGYHADISGPIADLPGFANRNVWGQCFAIQPFKVAPAPHPFFENGLKGEWVKHPGNSGSRLHLGGLFFSEMAVRAEF